MVVGSQARILYCNQAGRSRIAAAFNDAIASGNISAPIVSINLSNFILFINYYIINGCWALRYTPGIPNYGIPNNTYITDLIARYQNIITLLLNDRVVRL